MHAQMLAEGDQDGCFADTCRRLVAMGFTEAQALEFCPPLADRKGDHDIFGDGSVRLIFTPGHTLGHCSLLVRLPETGPVILSGDVAHNRENFRHRRVPTFNADQAATVTSMERIDALIREQGATFWINHDTAQSGTLPHAPRSIV